MLGVTVKTRKQLEAEAIKRKRRKRKKELENFYSNSKLDGLEQKRRVVWDMYYGR